MKNCRYRDRGSLHLAVRGEHLVDGAEGAATKLGSDRVGTGGIGIDHSNKADVAGLLERVIDASVIASEGADTDDGYIEQRKAPRKITRYCRRF